MEADLTDDAFDAFMPSNMKKKIPPVSTGVPSLWMTSIYDFVDLSKDEFSFSLQPPPKKKSKTTPATTTANPYDMLPAAAFLHMKPSNPLMAPLEKKRTSIKRLDLPGLGNSTSLPSPSVPPLKAPILVANSSSTSVVDVPMADDNDDNGNAYGRNRHGQQQQQRQEQSLPNKASSSALLAIEKPTNGDSLDVVGVDYFS